MTTLSDIRIAQAAQGGGFPLDEIATAVAVALAESAGNPLAVYVNVSTSSAPGSHDQGLWQINSYYHSDLLSKYDWRNPDQNARMAYLIWLERKRGMGDGWLAWSTYNSGSHRKFLARGRQAAADLGGHDPHRPPTGHVFTRLLYLTRPFMRGTDVRTLQGLVKAPADGVFGPITDGKVRAAQRRLNLEVDGVAGPKTVRALGAKWAGQ